MQSEGFSESGMVQNRRFHPKFLKFHERRFQSSHVPFQYERTNFERPRILFTFPQINKPIKSSETAKKIKQVKENGP